MKRIKFIFLTTLLLLGIGIKAFATWSIIVIDPKTKQIGIAGASCTNSVYGIGAIIPGKGAIVVQAMSNNNAWRKGLEMILADASPDEILKAIRNPEYDPEHQQYAIITVKYWNTPLTYTGTGTTAFKGTLTEKGISVQGNTLTSDAEIKAVMDAAKMAKKKHLPIEDILMLALEAGAQHGGDKRCGDTKASSAFLTVAKQEDDRDNPYLNLIIYGKDKNSNAVVALRKKFNDWKKSARR